MVDLNDLHRQLLAVFRQAAPQAHLFLVVFVPYCLDDRRPAGRGARVAGVRHGSCRCRTTSRLQLQPGQLSNTTHPNYILNVLISGRQKQQHSNTATQQHSSTATQQHSNTATQQHSSTAKQQHSNTAAQQHSNTAAQQHINTAAQQHSSTAAQQHSSTAAQQHSNTSAQQHSNTAAQQHSNTATQQTMSLCW